MAPQRSMADLVSFAGNLGTMSTGRGAAQRVCCAEESWDARNRAGLVRLQGGAGLQLTRSSLERTHPPG